MRPNHSFLVSTACAVALCLSACSGDNSISVVTDSPTLGVSPSLGVVNNATVVVFAADGVTELQRGDTGASGTVNLSGVASAGPVIIEVRGDADATYFDEAAGSAIAFPAGRVMRALVPATGGTVAVTPLTELAYQSALAAGQIPVTAAQARAINSRIGAALLPGVSDAAGGILIPPTPFDSTTAAGSLDDNDAGRYALVLAALAELADGDAAPALTVLQALVDDAADGVIDGQDDGTALTVPYGDFIADLSAALTAVASNFGTTALQQNASAQAPASTRIDDGNDSGGGNGGDDGPNGETVAATVNADLVGEYTLTAQDAVAGSPYNDGDTVQVNVSASGVLTVTNGPTLTDPFFRSFGEPNEAEIIWLDTATNFEWALTDNTTGTFNEINIGDASNPREFGIPAFLVQLRQGDGGGDNGNGGTPPQALLDLAGTYSMTAVKDDNTFRQDGFLKNQAFDLVIAEGTGVVTVGDALTFDPADAGYNAEDRTDGPPTARGINITKLREAGGTDTLRAFIYTRDDAVVAVDIIRQDGNSFRTLEAEPRPVDDDTQALFDRLNAIDAVALTVVEDDDTYNSGLGDLCNTFILDLRDGSSLTTNTSDVPFDIQVQDGIEAGGFAFASEIFRAKNSFRAVDGDTETLTLESLRVEVTADDTVALDALFMGAVRDRASADPAEIADAGCEPSDDPQVGNTGTAFVSGQGITGEIDGTRYTVQRPPTLLVEGEPDDPLIVEMNSLDDANSKWRLFIPKEVGTYQCDDAVEEVVVQYIQNGGFGADNGTSGGRGDCTMKVVQASASSIEGYFTGNLEPNSTADPVQPLTNGYFKIFR